MPDFDVQMKAIAGVQSTPQTRSDDELVRPRCLRDGTLLNFDWVQSLSLSGRVFCAQMGTLDTPETLQTAYDATLPSLVVQVPDSIIAIPLCIEMTFVATAAVSRFHAAISPVKVLAASAAAFTAVTPLNVRLGSSKVSACQAAHTVSTTGGTFTTGSVFLTHRGAQGDIDATALDGCYKWSVKNSSILPIVEDGGSICAMFYNSTGSGFAKIFWAELDKEDFRLRE